MQPDVFLVMGVIGMILILWAFLMIQTHRWTQDDLAYDLVNFIGSLLLVLYGIAGKVWPFVILNSIFALYSLKDVIVDLIARGKKKMESI